MAESPPPPSRRLPAEWACQSAVQLTWPHDEGDWAHNLQPARRCFTQIATALSRYQTVLIVARDDGEWHAISRALAAAGAHLPRCRFVLAPSDDSWARDHAPLTVTTPQGPALIKFTFNGWGGRHPANKDNQLAQALHSQGVFGKCPLIESGLILEGGAIETDGQGHFLLRESCIVNENRNIGMNHSAMAQALQEWLGAERIHWLSTGNLAGDDTDGHIDTLARFGPQGAVLHQSCDDATDPHFEPLAAMADALRGLLDPTGRERALIPLPLPRPIHDSKGRRMPAGYANFLVANQQVLVPTYQDPADETALLKIGAAFPEHEVRGIDCRALIRQGGSLHCVTMQYPDGVVPADAGLPAQEGGA
ncbi:agmatine/peptidylarginine deiminase [Natronospira proteinivora]|uniref:Agmatine/peptidylarginine deiminase n=1 Tax=Natronospira proteinivora TaxID=1807133 RepID=A0ABT1G5W2_9GAMM|nr:agmatine deiminase family protein [Natronospira proteinivora]MCP1726696.1 agmatine/peptidylarginine deiminase [Natronospira proteinivora]